MNVRGKRRRKIPQGAQLVAVQAVEGGAGGQDRSCEALLQDSDKCCLSAAQSLLADESFQHILRVLNTNVDGKQKIMFAMTSIKGIGRRFANIACKKAEVDMRKR